LGPRQGILFARFLGLHKRRDRLLDLVRSFTVFSDEPDGLLKRVAKYHKYWAVNATVESTVEAAGPEGDRRGGAVCHTQGSGKSIEMLLYAAKIMRDPRMNNRTLVLLTDRNDLDDQLAKYDYPPNLEDKAVEPVLEQTKLFATNIGNARSVGVAAEFCTLVLPGGITLIAVGNRTKETRRPPPPS